MTDVFLNARIIDSYGTTEAPGIASNGILNENNYDLKLVDVPSQMYFASDGIGEIVVRSKGKYDTREYWKNPEATASAWDSDGWYATGDIGQLKADKLAIVDRKSSLLELYVEGRSVWISSAKLEVDVYGRSNLVSKIFVHGDRMNDFLVAVVIPSGADVTAHALLSDFRRLATESGLPSWEVPATVLVEQYGDEVWSSANGLLSTTGKLKRNALFVKYQDKISNLCREITGNISKAQGKNDLGKEDESYNVSVTDISIRESLPVVQRPWQHQNISGIKDFLHFRFSSINPQEAEEMNAVKEKMDNLVVLIRPYLSELNALFAAKLAPVKNEILDCSETLFRTSTEALERLLTINEKGPFLIAALEGWISGSQINYLLLICFRHPNYHNQLQ
jgi:hypothetical protein